MSQKKPDYNWDGKRLDDLIVRTNSARRYVAEVSGIPETKLKNYISNVTKPGIDTLIKLADFFAVPLDYLCGRCDEETANDILTHYHETYEKIRVKDYEDCLFKRINGTMHIPQGYMAPWPYNLLDDIFCKPFDHPLTDDERKALDNALYSLTPHEHEVIKNYYKDDLTLEEVGYIYGVQRERIRQIVAKAIRKLRHPSRSNPILYGDEGNKVREEYNQKLFELQNREKDLEQKEKTFSYLVEKAELTDELKLITDYTKIHNDEAYHVSGHYRPSEAFLSLDLSVRAYNALLRAGIDTVSSIIKVICDGSIYRVRNLGVLTVEEIMDKVSDHIGYDVRTLKKQAG